jgi:outer membrane protein assembly factor BamA
MAALLLLLAVTAGAQDPYPVIREITFVGNDTTQPKVMLREMSVGVGEPADPALIERSRQAVLDLGLFNEVAVEQTPLDDGVRLTFTVKEKWYILPIPRYSVTSDGKDQYGMSLRWFNVAGLNHTLLGNWTNADDKKVNKGRSTRYRLGYSMPLVFDSPYNLGFGVGHSRTPIIASPDYVETFDSASVGLSRTFPVEAASQGWTVGGNVAWSNQDTHGDLAPDRYGMATAPGLFANYRDVRFKVYSEEGVSYGAEIYSATEGVASDYGYTMASARYSRLLAFGSTAHQNLNLLANAGSYHGGATGVTTDFGQFSLGGASSMRGYPIDRFQGDAYYYLAAEYLRPVGWDWLRLVVIAEAGNTFADAHSSNLSHIYGSVGVGLRLRLITFVNVEVEMGVAWPLDGGESRFFASRV